MRPHGRLQGDFHLYFTLHWAQPALRSSGCQEFPRISRDAEARCSLKDPAIAVYPGLYDSSLSSPTVFLLRSILGISRLRLDVPSFLVSDSPATFCINFATAPYMLHAAPLPVSFSSSK